MLDPKGPEGAAKPQLQLIPPVFEVELSKVMQLGAAKYGPWNWRQNEVEIMTYLGAMKRHIAQLLDGEDIDPESGASHLAHVAAGCAIILDATKHGTLVDNRPPAAGKRCFACERVKPLDQFKQTNNAHLLKQEAHKGRCYVCNECASKSTNTTTEK